MFLGLVFLTALNAGDEIQLFFTVKDNVAIRLTNPEIRLDLMGADPIKLVDDGSIEGDTPNDHIWHAKGKIRRSQRLEFSLYDIATGQTLGERSVFLPAADDASLLIRTTEGDPAMILESEGDVTPDGSGESTSVEKAGTTGSGDKFTYLLWVVLLIGFLGFGYLRIVVRRIYKEDFLPTWKLLDRYLREHFEESDR